jgi:predicted TIM-barrel fold metal-dependent hydrolase
MKIRMKFIKKFKYLGLLPLLAFTPSCAQTGSKEAKLSYYSVDDFPSVKKYDTHVHVYAPETSLIKQAAADNFHLLDVNGYMYPGAPPIEDQQALAVDHVRQFPKQIDYATTISVKNFNEENWQKETLAYLKKSFAQGAVAVKVWKNIGMELKDQQGQFVMIDHPKFDPILDFIAQNKITLLSHQGEPKNCWLPVDQMTVAGDKRYYTRNPQYHMYLHPEYPSYEAQMQARDHMVAKHPDLKVVSVHLASLEWSVAEIAKRLDQYPNLAVDMAARIPHLQNQAVTDWQQVYDFFIKYQDRILYGSDITINKDNTNSTAIQQNAHNTWLRDWKFFTTDEQLTNSNNIQFKGLRLPRAVVDKIYCKNAERWIPGFKKAKR